MKAGKGESKKG